MSGKKPRKHNIEFKNNCNPLIFREKKITATPPPAIHRPWLQAFLRLPTARPTVLLHTRDKSYQIVPNRTNSHQIVPNRANSCQIGKVSHSSLQSLVRPRNHKK